MDDIVSDGLRMRLRDGRDIADLLLLFNEERFLRYASARGPFGSAAELEAWLSGDRLRQALRDRRDAGGPDHRLRRPLRHGRRARALGLDPDRRARGIPGARRRRAAAEDAARRGDRRLRAAARAAHRVRRQRRRRSSSTNGSASRSRAAIATSSAAATVSSTATPWRAWASRRRAARRPDPPFDDRLHR